MFLQPAFFQYGQTAIFTAAQRKHDIYFRYPWSEQDDVKIELANGLTLSDANQLGPAPPTLLSGTSEYKWDLATTDGGRTINYARSFIFGSGGVTFFSSYRYAEFKNYFDSLRQQDNNAIALERK
jgi:hypothetical protein